ncbi:MAG: hypothetical protein RLZZ528_963 [Pseudomonadota bacterium]
MNGVGESMAITSAAAGRRLRGLARPKVLWAAGLLTLVALVSLAGITWVRQTTGMYELGQSATPYFLPDHVLLLYVLTPLATLATALFFLSPGLLLAATYGREKGAAYWLMSAVAWSTASITLVSTVAQLASGIVLKGPTFWLVVLTTALAALALFTRRLSAGRRALVRFGPSRTDLGVGVILFLGLLIALSPKFYWENFTGDGHGALKFARLFIHELWPFWMPEAGPIAKAPGLSMVLFVLPESWFVRLWGEAEYSVRAPLLMYVAMVYPILAALIRSGRDIAIRHIDHVLIGGAVALYAFVMIYSGGYNPYFGDSPMPAARETLALIFFIGFLLAYCEDRLGMMIFAGLMGSITIPTGGLWIGLIALIGWLFWRPRDIRRTNAAFIAVFFAVLTSVIIPWTIEFVKFYYPGNNEFSAMAIVDRLRYVSLADWERFAFAIVPCGIVPVIALFAWKRQDNVARVTTVLTAVFFLFFYLQGYRVLLHHFAPIMLTPLIVFWRAPWVHAGSFAPFARPLVAAGLAGALWLSWPVEMKMHNFDRIIGQHVETSGPRFENAPRDPGDRYRGFSPRAIHAAHVLLGQLFPIGYSDDDLKTAFFGAPLVWWYYSEAPKPEGQVINYRLKPLAEATPEDGTLFAQEDEYGLFIKDMALYEQHRTTILPANTGAPIFVVPRNQMFGGGATMKDRVVIDLVAVARKIVGM